MIGIYNITNLINNKKYYGASVDICKRWGVHKSKLNHNKHDNSHLQSSWDKNGEDSFSFEILMLCEESLLVLCEQWFLDNWVVWEFDYNICKVANAPPSWSGKERTVDTRLNISKTLKGKNVGETCGNSKLKVLEVLIIRELYNTKEYSQRKLGSIFNVDHSNIGDIVNRKTWKHI